MTRDEALRRASALMSELGCGRQDRLGSFGVTIPGCRVHGDGWGYGVCATAHALVRLSIAEEQVAASRAEDIREGR